MDAPANNAFTRHGLKHLSPSSLNLFAAEPALWVMERLLRRRGPVGAAAHRGTAAEIGIVEGLSHPGQNIEIAVDKAMARFRELTALSADPNREKEEKAVPDIVRVGVAGLKDYGKPSVLQRKIEIFPDNLPVPMIGYLDIEWPNGVMVDVKTQLRLASKITLAHARQVALYKVATSDNMDARIAYVTPKKMAVYGLENHRDHVKALLVIADTLHRFLKLSNDPNELARLVVPNVDSFYYNDPVTRQNAFEVWGI